MTDTPDAGTAPAPSRHPAARLATAIERVLDLALLAAIVVMVLSISWQVFSRYLLDHAPGWSEELARILMAWIGLLGSAAVLRRGGHISVTFFVDLLPAPARFVADWLRDLVILIMSASLVWYGYAFAVIGGRRASAAMEIPMFYPYLAIPVGAGFIALLLVLSRLARAPVRPAS